MGNELRSREYVRWGDTWTVNYDPAPHETYRDFIGPQLVQADSKSPHVWVLLLLARLVAVQKGDIIIPRFSVLIGTGSAMVPWIVQDYTTWNPYATASGLSIRMGQHEPIPAQTIAIVPQVRITPNPEFGTQRTVQMSAMVAPFANPWMFAMDEQEQHRSLDREAGR